MKVLAQADRAQLERLRPNCEPLPDYEFLRRPEVGLLMVRARVGGAGPLFNLGEVTVSRCAVRLEPGLVGQAVVLGRDLEHARLAALFDGLLQDPRRQEQLLETVCHPLERLQQRRRRRLQGKTATTRVDFSTLLRGEG